MAAGIIYDIREFTTHDGPGIRTTVFLKGCPLRCAWCHNPEGLSPEPQILRSATGERTAGRTYSPEQLAKILNAQSEILRASDGGVTFSGGEPLAQADFLESVLDRLDRLHVVLDTSGCAGPDVFARVAGRCDLIYFDLKLIDRAAHRRYTGVTNDAILGNLGLLPGLGVAFVVRVPLVPGVTDTDENLRAIAETVRPLAGLLRVDLLPYNRAAGGKYASLGLRFDPPFDESQPVNANAGIFRGLGIPVCVRGKDME